MLQPSTCIKNNKTYFKNFCRFAFFCLNLAVPEWIAHTHNAFGSLLLCVANHDEEFVELLASGHWLEEFLKFLLLYLYNLIQFLLLIWIYHRQKLDIFTSLTFYLLLRHCYQYPTKFQTLLLTCRLGLWSKIFTCKIRFFRSRSFSVCFRKSTFSEAVFNSLLLDSLP